ncbi:MAG: sigma-70 family RNA polymerase sigma factor [Caldilineaceae bacterium]|nr:sigma-70 family RNA polymerase sigma factor [Caldilineaceae bacterium]
MSDNQLVMDENQQKSGAEQRQPAPAPEPENDSLSSQRTAEALLVHQAKQDANAFGILYERYVDRIYAYVYNRIHNAQEAEDLTARTFYRALAKLDTYEDRGLPFSAWLYRIAHNLVANHHRDNSRRQFVPFDMLNLAGRRQNEPEEVIDREEDHETLWAAIERLPAERRDLLIYKFGNRLSNLEIGELLDKSEGAIKSLYFRTLAALRKELKGYVWGKDEADEGGE